MKIFTVGEDTVSDGVMVEEFEVTAGKTMPVVKVGEAGRGRKVAYLPVRLQWYSFKQWLEEKRVCIQHVSLVQTSSGRYRLQELVQDEPAEDYIVVLRGWIGYRGWNKLTLDDDQSIPSEWILAEGRIAQGLAGGMGSGGQWVLRVRPPVELRLRIGGRLYGSPSEYVIVCGKCGPVLYSADAYELERDYVEE